MTYMGFLALFLVGPILLLTAVLEYRRRDQPFDAFFRVWRRAVVFHAAIALVYTTPWDNFLVARGIWTYDPARVIGWVIGWVPIEEYAFFVLQPLLVGMWGALLWRVPKGKWTPSPARSARWRWTLGIAGLGLWIANLMIWRVWGNPWMYMGLILIWGLPPLILQWVFGGDLLWSRRGDLLRIWIPPALYLSAADALAIREGIWRISGDWSTGWKMLGLPAEEGVFFFLTSLLIANGSLLMVLPESRARLRRIQEMVRLSSAGPGARKKERLS
ncbi:MAG: lycopene cyclase domain-containing protein [Thermoflexus sp.]|nr:lycopene cyclase domain-containing protein [Thermoflexus sp.]